MKALKSKRLPDTIPTTTDFTMTAPRRHSTKLFDALGVCAVIAWCGFIGALIWSNVTASDVPEQATFAASERIKMTPGHREYLDMRGKKDAGVGFRAHTFVKNRWIVEHNLMRWLSTPSGLYYTSYKMRALTDKDGHLKSYNLKRTDLDSRDGVDLNGTVKGETLTIQGKTMGDEEVSESKFPKGTTIEPLLAAMAAPLTWNKNQKRTFNVLEPFMGRIVPTTLQFSHRENLNIFEQRIDAMIFDRFYPDGSKGVWAITDDGWVVVEKLPAKINVSSVPQVLHQAKLSAAKRLRKTLLKQYKQDTLKRGQFVVNSPEIERLIAAQHAYAEHNK